MEKQIDENPIPEPVLPPKSKALPIIFSLLVLILLTSTVYLGYQNWTLRNQIKTLQSSTPTSTPDETANLSRDEVLRDWKTYTDLTSGFSLQYPPNWALKNSVVQNNSVTIYVDSPTPDDFPYSILVEPINKLPDYRFTSSIINGYAAYRTQDKTPKEGFGGILSYYLTKDNSTFVDIELTPYNPGGSPVTGKEEEYLAIFNQILSTFRFTD